MRSRSANLEQPSPALSVVIVNYASWADTTRLAESLSTAPEVARGEAEIVVVDNATPGEIPLPWSAVDPPARLVRQAENGGFAAGVNAGWRVSRGRWLLLLNPDTIAPGDLIARILERIAVIEARPSEERPAIVGFGLSNPDGSPQPSAGAEPTLLRLLVEPFFRRERRKYLRPHPTLAGSVPWVTGACALVEGALLDRLNGMDETFFLYYEEVALCRAARRLGRGVEIDPTLSVVHLRPLQNRAVPPALRVITRHSRLVYFRDYAATWQYPLLIGLTRLEAALRGAWAGLRSRPTERRAWRLVDRITREMAGGRDWRGPEVRDLAASLTPAASSAPHRLRTVPPGRETACPTYSTAPASRS